MVKLVTPLHFRTAAEAFSTRDNLFTFASAALSCAKEPAEAAVTAGTVLAYIGICELFARAHLQKPDMRPLCLLQLELFDRLDDFETEEAFEANVVKRSAVGTLQQSKSHVFASRTSTSCSCDAAYPAVKSPSFRNQNQEINFSEFDSTRPLQTERHQIQSDDIRRIVADLEHNLSFRQ